MVSDVVLSAGYFSAITTSGFWIAFLLSTVLLYFIQTCAKPDPDKPLKQKHAKVGPIMMAVELIDAIPEAALLANVVGQASDHGNVWTLVIAILFMNISNGLFTSFDVLSIVENSLNNVIMFVVMNYSTGMLSYAISVTIYGKFKEEWDVTNVNQINEFIALVAGTLVGSFFIFVVKYVHDNYKKLYKRVKRFFKKKKGRTYELSSATDVESELEELVAKNADGKTRDEIICWKFLGRILFSFIFLTILSAWSVGLTMGIASVYQFLYESSEKWSSIVQAFLEGLGGGAFLGTIACTIIPELGKTYGMYDTKNSLSNWISFSGLFFFIFGLLSSSIIDVTL